MSDLTVSSVVSRISGESGIFAGFVNFEDADGNEARLTFHNVEGVQKEFSDGSIINPEYVEMAEKALNSFLDETGQKLAPKGAKN